MVHIHREILGGFDLREKGFYGVVRQFFDFPAFPAYQVVVGSGVANFVHFAACAQVGGDHQAQVAEELQVAVEGGFVHRGGFGLDAGEDFVEGGVAAALADGVQDHLALGGQAEALFADAVLVIQVFVAQSESL